jgi:hypothetical protein
LIDVLPLGGSELAEIGLLFGLAFMIHEWADGLRHLRIWWRGN